MKLVGRWRGLVLLAFCVVVAGGCGKAGPKVVPVYGVVVNGDKPIPAARVLFSADVSDKEEGFDASSHTDAQGNFKLRTLEHGEGAALGRYKVVVTCYEGPGARLIPGKFKDLATTPLTIEVKEGGLKDLKLDLSK